MTMKSKQFHFESHDGKFYTALFSLTKVDDKEVYEFLAKEEKETDFLHYGYITKAMAEKLLSLDANGKRYIDRINFSRDVPSKDDETEIYGQKIVLDLPNKIDDESFLTNFSLLPCTYASKRAKPLFLKVHNIFSYSSTIGNIVLVPDEKNNVYETDIFSISNQLGQEQEILLNICENKTQQLRIGPNDNSIEPNGIKYEIVTTEPNASIDISSCRIPTRS